MKVKTFKIVGSKNLLTAIEEELSSLGFTINLSPLTVNPTYIASSMVICETIDEYKRLFWGNVKCKWNKTFELPQQYDEALAFAKEQLSDKYWVKIPEKWGKGTFGVITVAGEGFEVGHIDKIYKVEGKLIWFKKYRSYRPNNTEYSKARFEWFATKKEAEEFAETLKPKPTPKPKPVVKEVEPKFKVGDYITSTGIWEGHIGRITKLSTNSYGGVTYNYWGFTPSDNTFKEDDDNYCVIASDDRLATSQEIEEFLIRVAKLKGFIKGVPFNTVNQSSLVVGQCRGIINDDWNYDSSIDTLTNRGTVSSRGNVYSKGVWATIIPESKPVEPRFTRTKKVEDLVYPDVVHCKTLREYSKLKKHQPSINNHYDERTPYLLIGCGCYGKPYEEGSDPKYVNYEFSNIIFPEEFVLPEKWVFEITSTNYPKFKHLRSVGGELYGYISSNSFSDLSWGFWYKKIPIGYTLITFEQFEKHVLGETTLTKLPFGNLEFTIHKGDDHAHCSQGIVYKSEIQAIVEWFNKGFTLLGHKMELTSTAPIYIKFGCCEGTREQAEAILKAFN